jgi:hypothetical protein
MGRLPNTLCGADKLLKIYNFGDICLRHCNQEYINSQFSRFLSGFLRGFGERRRQLTS